MKISYVSIIVSTEEGVNFYKGLGFKEINREVRKEMHDEIVVLSNQDLELRLYKDKTHPIRNRNPESLGIRYICLETDNLDAFSGVEIKEDRYGRFIFLNDPDSQPIQIRERK